ncbi:MAG: CDP-alcohol phosphatidyltransferase family protein [Desulfobacteraceae bacterium]|jgi:phosphatidylglycerophosphate synthase
MSLRTSILGASYLRLIETHLLPYIVKRGITANQVTLWGAALAVLVPVAFWFKPSLGLLLIILSGIADSLDGLVARKMNQVSELGTFIDSSLDRVSDFFYLLGIWSMFWRIPGRGLSTLVLMVALLLTVLISYTKARAEGLGIQCRVGFMDRGLRVVYLIVWCGFIVFVPLQIQITLWAGLILYCGLTFFTVLQRIFHVRDQCRKTDSASLTERE